MFVELYSFKVQQTVSRLQLEFWWGEADCLVQKLLPYKKIMMCSIYSFEGPCPCIDDIFFPNLTPLSYFRWNLACPDLGRIASAMSSWVTLFTIFISCVVPTWRCLLDVFCLERALTKISLNKKKLYEHGTENQHESSMWFFCRLVLFNVKVLSYLLVVGGSTCWWIMVTVYSLYTLTKKCKATTWGVPRKTRYKVGWNNSYQLVFFSAQLLPIHSWPCIGAPWKTPYITIG